MNLTCYFDNFRPDVNVRKSFVIPPHWQMYRSFDYGLDMFTCFWWAVDEDGRCFVAIDPARIRDEADGRAKLAHELGHCVTGAFYNRYSDYDNRQRHENKADKWAVCAIVTEDELDEAVAEGCVTLWELAEHFGVPEPFMKKAVCWYTYGNLAAELYF